MGVSKPQAYCQELQSATARARLSGGYEPGGVSSRDELRTGKRTHPQEDTRSLNSQGWSGEALSEFEP